MQTLYNGVEVFTNGDDYNLADDVAAAFASANLVVPVPSEAVRDALPDPYAGMTVARTDLPGCPLETHDGDSWPISDTGTITLEVLPEHLFSPVTVNGWAGITYAVRNGIVTLNGAVSRGSGWGDDQIVARMPAELWPAFRIQGAGCQVIPSTGDINLPAGGIAASFSASWPLY
jgi:hypothetical protein